MNKLILVDHFEATYGGSSFGGWDDDVWNDRIAVGLPCSVKGFEAYSGDTLFGRVTICEDHPEVMEEFTILQGIKSIAKIDFIGIRSDLYRQGYGLSLLELVRNAYPGKVLIATAIPGAELFWKAADWVLVPKRSASLGFEDTWCFMDKVSHCIDYHRDQ